MASKSYNGGRGSQAGRWEFPLVSKTPSESGTKLLGNAQRAVDPFRQRPSQFRPADSEDYKYVSLKRMEDEMKEMRQVLVTDNMKMLAHKVGKLSSRVRVVRRETAPQDELKVKRAL